MRTILFATAMLLAPTDSGGSPGGAAAGSDPTGATPDTDLKARLEAERAEAARIRELTPVQEFEVRGCPGAANLGAIVGTPEGVRLVTISDARTERFTLQAGDSLQIHVLAGEGLKTWEFWQRMANNAADQARAPLGEVTTGQIAPAVDVASLAGADTPQTLSGLDVQNNAQASDPLEATMPAAGETIPPIGETKPASADTAALDLDAELAKDAEKQAAQPAFTIVEADRPE